MKTIQSISADTNYTAATLGSWDTIAEYVYNHPSGMDIPGKVFIGEALQCTGTEVSFQTLPVGTSISFLHTHKQNEELYVVLRGTGEYQVDGKIIPIAEGSLVRVAPAGARSWRNSGDCPLLMMVIQSKAGSLTELGVVDGSLSPLPLEW